MNVWWIICKFVPKNWIIMEIRFAQNRDIPRIHQLLTQVNNVHAKGRPDLFKSGNRKYTDEQLRQIIANVEHSPIFVLVDDNDMVLGYCFGIVEQFINDNNRTDVKTLYIDDLCVDEKYRRQHIAPAHRTPALRPCGGLCPQQRILQHHAQRVGMQPWCKGIL